MSKPIADPTDVAPRQAGAQNFCFFAQMYGRFADEQQFALNRCDGLRISSEGVEAHSSRKTVNLADCIQDVLEQQSRFSKRQG